MGHHRQTHIDIVRNRFFVFRGRRCESADAFMRVLNISSVKGVRRKLLRAGAAPEIHHSLHPQSPAPS